MESIKSSIAALKSKSNDSDVKKICSTSVFMKNLEKYLNIPTEQLKEEILSKTGIKDKSNFYEIISFNPDSNMVVIKILATN